MGLNDYRGDYPALKANRLFRGFDDVMLDAILPSLKPEKVRYEKGDMIIPSGEKVTRASIMLSGKAAVAFTGFKGEDIKVRLITQGSLFGLEASLLGVEYSPSFYVQAIRRTTVVRLDMTNMRGMRRPTVLERRLVNNIMFIMAENNVRFYRRIHGITQKHIRDKLRLYLGTLTPVHGAYTLPMNQTDLALELGVDRSALSREFSKLQSEGVLEMDRRTIRLKDPAFLFTQPADNAVRDRR